MYNLINLDISGVPGIGKTLCVKEATNKLKQKNNKSMKFAYVNAYHIKNQRDIFKTILYELTGISHDATAAMYVLSTK
jgi:Cdc6-like AAA superfamily ATPase